MGKLLLAGLVLSTSACVDDKLGRIGDPCARNEQCVSGRCDELVCKPATFEDASVETILFADGAPSVDGSVAFDGNAVFDGTVAPDTTPFGCACADPLDICRDFICYKEQRCAQTPCPDGYRDCDDDRDRCYCTDLTTCGALCGAGGECAEHQRCEGTHCVPLPSPDCEHDWMCASGERCAANPVPFGYGGPTICRRLTGILPLGSVCDGDEDCESELCLDQRCTARCTNGSDCGLGEVCVEVYYQNLADGSTIESDVHPVACLALAEVEPFCAACSATSFCEAHTPQCEEGAPCVSPADCPIGWHCEGERYGASLYAPFCRPGPSLCANADDLRISGHSNLCTNRLSCAIDADCATGYTCVEVGRSLVCAAPIVP